MIVKEVYIENGKNLMMAARILQHCDDQDHRWLAAESCTNEQNVPTDQSPSKLYIQQNESENHMMDFNNDQQFLT